MLTTTARNAIQASQTRGVNAAAPMRRSTAQSNDLAMARQCCSDKFAPDAAPCQRLQRRDQKRQVAERRECELQRIPQLGAFGFDIALKTRTQVRRDDEQALVELPPEQMLVGRRLRERQSDDLDLLGSHGESPDGTAG